jgi:enoyl-CoA hydratase/carnithine racemase
MNFGSASPISTGHFANGGQVSTSTRSATAIDQGQMQFQQMLRAVGMMPNPVVSVAEINAVNGAVGVKEQLGLG